MSYIFREFYKLYLENLSKHYETLEKLKLECRKIREENLEKLNELWKIAKENFEKEGIEVVFISNYEEFWKIFPKYIEDETKIIKSKTNVGKELRLTEKLREMGIEVCETDCGDFIIDVLNEEPSHPLIPALHLSVEEIAKKLSDKFNEKVEPNPEAIKDFVHKKVKEFLKECNVGITGANFISAEGSIFIQENEGNISLVSRLVKTHIVITSLEKIVDTNENAIKLCKLQSLMCLAQEHSTYINVISGPSQTGDIGGKLLKGMYGPKEVIIFVIDNGRSNILKSEFREILKCINCGACLTVCPIIWQLKSKFGYELKGMRGLTYQFFNKNIKDIFEFAYKCSLCGMCEKICPMGIKWTKIIRLIRNKCIIEGLETPTNKKMRENIKKYGNPVGEIKEGENPLLYCC